MYTHDPVSLLSLHHREHSELVAKAATISASPLRSARTQVSNGYYAVVRRAYVRARAARIATSRAAH